MATLTVATESAQTKSTGQPADLPHVSPLLLAPLFGLIAGLGEVVLTTLRKTVWLNPGWPLSRDYFWMTPLADVILFMLAGLILVLVGRVWSRAAATSSSIIVFTALCVVSWLTIPPWFGWYAEILLAAGIGVQAANLARRFSRFFTKTVEAFAGWTTRALPRRSTAKFGHAQGVVLGLAAVLILLLVGTGFVLKRAADEQAAIAALPAPPASPNVLLIVWDTVRAASTTLHEYERDTTPHLARRAAEGFVYENAFATAPWTLPSQSGMFTGRWHHELSANWLIPLNDEFPTLAEVLTERGFSTAGFVANTSYLTFKSGVDRGFIHYEDFPVTAGEIFLSSAIGRVFVVWNGLRNLIGHHRTLNARTAYELNDRVLGWLPDDNDRPFFVFLNYFDAHDPLLPPEPFHSRFAPRRPWGPFTHGANASNHADKENRPAEDIQMMVDRYDASIAFLDEATERLLTELDNRGVLENTLVIITSDHGEHWGEKGMMEHGTSLYQQLLHVPLVVLPPGASAASRISAPASLRDLPATILAYAGLPNGVFPGAPLARLHDAAPVPPDTLLAKFDTKQRRAQAVIVGPYKYIRTVDQGERLQELFHYIDDPAEELNLMHAATHMPLGLRLDSALTTQLRKSSTVEAGVLPEITSARGMPNVRRASGRPTGTR